MIKIPQIPATAPFDAQQRAWLNGFIAAYFHDVAISDAQSAGETSTGAPARRELDTLWVLFASQTGTAEALAQKIGYQAGSQGFKGEVREMTKYETVPWNEVKSLLIVTSTYGDGDIPDNGTSFWNFLETKSPRLEGVRYSVLGLGDSKYPAFCEAGKKFDAKLAQLGAVRILDRVDCDLDYEGPAGEWSAAVFKKLSEGSEKKPGSVASATPKEMSHEKGKWSKSNPYLSRLLLNRLLTATESEKETRHFVLDLNGSGIEYEAGDALGVFPENCPELVNEILQSLRMDGEEAVPSSAGGEISLRKALLTEYDICQLTPALLDQARKLSNESSSLSPEAMAKCHVVDLLSRVRGSNWTPADFVKGLKKIAPRLYSISSSPRMHPNEIHLTIRTVRYMAEGRKHKGVCSTFLADRTGTESRVRIFLHSNKNFRLPADPAKSRIIMVGPGTGIAPFRAFLQELKALGIQKQAWLFFGEQRSASDFLYRDELDEFVTDHTLARIDTAFSRDQEKKIYVQDRMRECASELWSWLDSGAYFYVCGDASRMAKDVDAALQEIIAGQGKMSSQQAQEYLQNLKTQKRYQRDVY